MDSDAVKPAMIEESIIDMLEKLKSKIQFNQKKTKSDDHHFVENMGYADYKNAITMTHDGALAFKLALNTIYNLVLLLEQQDKLIKIYRSLEKQIVKENQFKC